MVLVSSVLVFFRLGSTPFIDYDEATYAQVVKESVISGNYSTFTYLGQNWFDKPPLYFWLAEAGVGVFGMNELAMRLPSAMAALACVILVWLVILRLSGSPPAAFLGGMALVTSGSFLDAARQLRLDVPVALCVMISISSFIMAVNKSGGMNGGGENKVRRDHWLVGVGMGAGLGILAKSVIGLLSGPFILAWSLIRHEWKWLKSWYFWLGMALMIVIIMPWHIHESTLFGQTFWHNYLGRTVFQRVQTGILGGSVGVWSYVYNLFRYTEPWIVIFVIGFVYVVCNYRRKLSRHAELAGAALAFAASVAFIFLLFCISETKLFYYLIPIYPLMAVAIGLVFDLVEKSSSDQGKKILLGLAGIFLVVGLSSAVSFGFNVGDPYGLMRLTGEEKALGEVIAGHPTEEMTYSVDFPFWETIRYYAGGRQVSFLPEKEPSRPFMLVVSQPLDRPDITAYHSTVIYSSADIALLEVK